jgi:hypothetical protein
VKADRPREVSRAEQAGIVRGASLQSQACTQRAITTAAIMSARGPVTDDTAWAAALQQERSSRTATNMQSAFQELARVPAAAAALQLGPMQTTHRRRHDHCGQRCVCQRLSG